MKRILLLIFSFISLSALAQQSDTLYSYTNIGGKEVKKDKAVNVYKVYRRDSTSWVRTTSDRNLILLKKESFNDADLKILNGPYYEYYSSGKTKLKGSYLKGNKSGLWILYDQTGKAAESVTFARDKRNGVYSLYHENGNIKTQGRYLNDNEIGEWITYKENGDVETSRVLTLPNDLNTVIVSINPPEFNGGMEGFKRYLQRSVVYPQEARKAGIIGTVSCSFLVDLDGSVKNVVVKSSPDAGFSKEAIRVLEASPKWKPGFEYGKPTKIRYNINVNFAP